MIKNGKLNMKIVMCKLLPHEVTKFHWFLIFVCVAYFMPLSVTETICPLHGMMVDELERIWEEAVIA